jgi:hypothetical protein
MSGCGRQEPAGEANLNVKESANAPAVAASFLFEIFVLFFEAKNVKIMKFGKNIPPG